MAEYREFQDQQEIEGTRYRVVRLIGAGGMGTVYEVEHVELGKRFVLKALLRELARRDDLVQRLRNEWRALGRLEHPNIVTVTDAGTTTSGVPFFVMERLEGETLAQRMRRVRRFPVADAVNITAAILDGLAAAHEIGIVHRDVKPPNVILVSGDRPKILDFGVAKITDDPGVVTARGVAIGTPRYMSPEQARGEPVDGRADVYSAGLLLFEMVTGVGPFDDARDSNELILAHLARVAPPLSSLAMGVPPALDRLAAALLHKNRHRRPATARQAAQLLREALSAANDEPDDRALIENARTVWSPPARSSSSGSQDDTARPGSAQPSRPRDTVGTHTAISPPPFSSPPSSQGLPFQSTMAGVMTAAEAGIDPSPSGTSPSLRAVVTSVGDTRTDSKPESFRAVPSRPLEVGAVHTEILTSVPEPEAKDTRTVLPRREAPSSVTPPPISPVESAGRPRRSRAVVLGFGVALVAAAVASAAAIQRQRGGPDPAETLAQVPRAEQPEAAQPPSPTEPRPLEPASAAVPIPPDPVAAASSARSASGAVAKLAAEPRGSVARERRPKKVANSRPSSSGLAAQPAASSRDSKPKSAPTSPPDKPPAPASAEARPKRGPGALPKSGL